MINPNEKELRNSLVEVIDCAPSVYLDHQFNLKLKDRPKKATHHDLFDQQMYDAAMRPLIQISKQNPLIRDGEQQDVEEFLGGRFGQYQIDFSTLEAISFWLPDFTYIMMREKQKILVLNEENQNSKL